MKKQTATRKESFDYNVKAAINNGSKSIPACLGFDTDKDGEWEKWGPLCDLAKKATDDTEDYDVGMVQGMTEAKKLMGVKNPSEHTMGDVLMMLVGFKMGQADGYNMAKMVASAKSMSEAVKYLRSGGKDEEKPNVEVAEFDEPIHPDHDAIQMWDAFGLPQPEEDLNMQAVLKCAMRNAGGESGKMSKWMYEAVSAIGRKIEPDFEATKRDMMCCLVGKAVMDYCRAYRITSGGDKRSIIAAAIEGDKDMPEGLKEMLCEVFLKD